MWMCLEEIPDRLTHVDEIVGPIMPKVLDRIQDHIRTLAAAAPLRFLDQNIMWDLGGFGITVISPSPVGSPMRYSLIGNNVIRCAVDGKDGHRPRG